MGSPRGYPGSLVQTKLCCADCHKNDGMTIYFIVAKPRGTWLDLTPSDLETRYRSIFFTVVVLRTTLYANRLRKNSTLVCWNCTRCIKPECGELLMQLDCNRSLSLPAICSVDSIKLIWADGVVVHTPQCFWRAPAASPHWQPVWAGAALYYVRRPLEHCYLFLGI